MKIKKAFITGITGQTGSFLAELLLSKNYEVHGIIRRSSSFNTDRIDHIFDKLRLHYADLMDANSLIKVISIVQPDEIYNLGCQSHVKVSFDQPIYTADTVAMGTLRLLEAIINGMDRTAVKLYQASSSEMFGSAPPPQDEQTPFHPRSPYACAKVFAYNQVVNYREAYGLFACNGISFNHESERRGETFVTRKITRAATRIKMGLQNELRLGNLDARRDWNYAPDVCEAIWRMLQHDAPDDYVIATNKSYSIRDWLDIVFDYLELDWGKYVRIDSAYYRPAEVDHLRGDYTKIHYALGWKPKTDIKRLAQIMVDHDLELARNERYLEDKLNEV